ncbi:hypothetical protein PR048_004143 [Dryococelus australis]|uniref:Uncharacterized protein n=1 Tax=Dryococelus australis TaxID=614101 RepID=A0ABQ9I4N3_9NEOP|nr:hypothetical protein PR048_004143 [Dryococelus australis]
MIFDYTESYTVPFLLAGVPPVLGSLALFAVRCVGDDKEQVPPRDLAVANGGPVHLADKSAAGKLWAAATRVRIEREAEVTSHAGPLTAGTGD